MPKLDYMYELEVPCCQKADKNPITTLSKIWLIFSVLIFMVQPHASTDFVAYAFFTTAFSIFSQQKFIVKIKIVVK